MTVTDQALQLPRVEKLKLMEALWADLSSPDVEFESPQWHEAEFRKTEERLSRGTESLVAWETAKKKLRGQ